MKYHQRDVKLIKIIERYQNSFGYITVEKIISKQSIFVSVRTTNMQFSKMKNKITAYWI